MAIHIHDVAQRTPEWFELRRGRVTASNAEILLTKGLDDALASNDKRFGGNFYTDRGLTLEPMAVDAYERIYDVSVVQVGFVTNDEYPNAGASPDGIVGDTLIEIKCFMDAKHMSIKSINDVPFSVLAQVQFSMLVCGLPKAHIVLFNPDVPATDAFKCFELDASLPTQRNINRKLKVAIQSQP